MENRRKNIIFMHIAQSCVCVCVFFRSSSYNSFSSSSVLERDSFYWVHTAQHKYYTIFEMHSNALRLDAFLVLILETSVVFSIVSFTLIFASVLLRLACVGFSARLASSHFPNIEQIIISTEWRGKKQPTVPQLLSATDEKVKRKNKLIKRHHKQPWS